MKKIAFLMMAFVAACSLTACNDTETTTASYTDFASVIGSQPVTLYTDKGETLVVGKDKSGNFNPSYGQRTLVYYNLLQSANGTIGSTKPIEVVGYYIFDLANTAVLAEGEQTNYGGYDIDIYTVSNQYYLVHTTKNVIDLAIIVPAKTELSQHNYTLVLDETAPYEGDNNLHLRLCHNAIESEVTGAAVHTALLVSFSMADFAEYIEGTNGVTITVPGLNQSSDVQHTFKWIE